MKNYQIVLTLALGVGILAFCFWRVWDWDPKVNAGSAVACIVCAVASGILLGVGVSLRINAGGW